MPIIDKKLEKIYNILVNNTSIIKHGGSNMTTVEKETLESILDDLRRISSNLEEVLDNVENTSIV